MAASLSDDLYVKTALMRIPFAILGAGAIALFALPGMAPFRKREDRLLFLAAFLFLELLSVSLALHLREVRYYSLAIFLSAALLLPYLRHRITGTLSFKSFVAISVPLLFLLFNTFIPAYMGFLLFLVFDCILSAARSLAAFPPSTPAGDRLASLASAGGPLLVVPISALTVLPVAVFFRTAEISRAISGQFGFDGRKYLDHVAEIVTTLGRYEFLYAAIFIKCLMLGCLFVTRNEERERGERDAVRISNLLGLYGVAFLLMVSRLPFHMLFERYFILLQPVIAAMLALDAMVTARLMARTGLARSKTWRKAGILVPALCLLAYTGINKLPGLKGHVHELVHPYFGPLDYAIGYIHKNYRNPERLVIATNYEENAYMYYLGGRVTIGFVGKNLAQDMLAPPDIIVYRGGWGNFLPEFKFLLQGGEYNMVLFPVADLMVNNIPELRRTKIVYHRFATPLTDDNDKRLVLFARRR
jgi:hypothetical protein